MCNGKKIPDFEAYQLPAADEPAPVAVRQGVLEVFTDDKRIAPLKIATPSGGGNHYIKLVDADSKEAVMTAYIEEGQTLSMKVPLGSYRLRYAAGKTW